jgi:hypothetical protein
MGPAMARTNSPALTRSSHHKPGRPTWWSAGFEPALRATQPKETEATSRRPSQRVVGHRDRRGVGYNWLSYLRFSLIAGQVN